MSVAVKIRDLITTLEDDGWPSFGSADHIASSRIRPGPALSRFPVSRATTWRPEP
jgi:hypothetical protein